VALLAASVLHAAAAVSVTYGAWGVPQDRLTPLASMDFAQFDPLGAAQTEVAQTGESPEPEPEPEPSAAVPAPTPAPDPEPLPAEDPRVIDGAAQEPESVPVSPTPEATPTPAPVPSATPTPTPTPDVTPTPTPLPSATPTPTPVLSVPPTSTPIPTAVTRKVTRAAERVSATSAKGGVAGASVGTGKGDPDAYKVYAAEIRNRMARYLKYPSEARSRGLEGVATVTFTVESSGRIVNVRVVKGSGQRVLDDEASALMRRISPLPPIPAAVKRPKLVFTVPIRFKLR
jgi:protein TonB